MNVPELSSINMSLSDLATRLAQVGATQQADRRDDIAYEIFAVERLILNASRRLAKLVDAQS